MKIKLSLLAFLMPIWSVAQQPQTDTLSILFMGDIMGHDAQIAAAYDAKTNTYQYDSYFAPLKDLFENADLTIANLEVTLAGPPHKGYPQFSSPNALAYAIKNAGIDILTTANNHSFDRGEKGVTRTLAVLDSLRIKRTGTFKDSTDKKRNHPLIIARNNIKLAFLNYTYGTNGLTVSGPASINRIHRQTIKEDILHAQELNPDQIIVLFHWGKEYQSQPEKVQEDLVNYCKSLGANIVIGSHPHVLQRLEWHKKDHEESFVAYSLGNFVSNQRTRMRDGGALVQLSLIKTDSIISIADAGYYLTWVHKPIIHDRFQFTVVPAARFGVRLPKPFRTTDKEKMQIFIDDSRKLLKANNVNVDEYFYSEMANPLNRKLKPLAIKKATVTAPLRIQARTRP
jgi:poly-gamma-glutamate capsule biosynthesis protein CapA/YwtB (metallophosphatase superfamily)